MSKFGSDRRMHRRVETSFKLQGSPEHGGVVARMVAHNLSMAGLYCTSSADFPELTRLAVRMLLPVNGAGNPATRPVDVEAVVVRREDSSTSGEERFELALFFTKIDDSAKRRLASFIDGYDETPSDSPTRID